MAGVNDTLPGKVVASVPHSPNVYLAPSVDLKVVVDDPLALDPAGWPEAHEEASPTKKAPLTDAQTNEVANLHAMFDWYEHFHVVPRGFDFGNLLSDQSVAIEVFSAFRSARHEWTAFVNNAGLGVELVGEPALPALIFAFQGYQMTLDVSTIGDPFVDETLDFFFDVGGTIFVPIEIQRIVLWGNRPEQEYVEVLSFLTDVLRKKDGSEQRPSLRKNPRQFFEFDYFEEEGTFRQTLENLLFDWQARAFGVPDWIDECFLSAAATAGDMILTVDETAFRDFRVGGLVCVFLDQQTFDVTEITAKTATTISLASPLLNSWPAGTSVFPLKVCEAPGSIQGGRYPVGLSQKAIRFRVQDNDASLANLAPFSSYNGKLLVDRGNSMRSGTIGETFTIELDEIDNATGARLVSSSWRSHKRGHRLSIRAQGRQAIWELRGLAHAIRGQQVSFYVVRDSDDLEPAANLVSGSNSLTITRVGYTQFVRQRQPKNVLRINFASGAAPLFRVVASSSLPSPGIEELVLDTTWPATFTPSQISRIEYVEKVRSDTDDLRLEFSPGELLAHLTFPVQVVFE